VTGRPLLSRLSGDPVSFAIWMRSWTRFATQIHNTSSSRRSSFISPNSFNRVSIFKDRDIAQAQHSTNYLKRRNGKVEKRESRPTSVKSLLFLCLLSDQNNFYSKLRWIVALLIGTKIIHIEHLRAIATVRFFKQVVYTRP
jgi:hypothetical protein